MLGELFDSDEALAVDALCQTREEAGTQPELAADLIRKDGRRVAVRLKAEGCRFDGRPCVLVIVEPQTQRCRNEGWDSDLEGCFGSEDPLGSPVCA